MAELAVEVGGLDDRDDELVVETITGHAAALLRTARRYSLCADDAHDAYQRAVEIFLTRAARLRRDTVVNWLHQVVKNEALAVREARRRLVASEEVEPDGHTVSPEDRVVSIDRTQRAAEALSRLKPQEVQALWLRAQGLSYQEIAQRQSWTYTKVNRCLTEGRKAFLERYAGIESGEECRRWAPVVTALVDGEASARDVREVRAHLRNCAACRSTLRELRAAGPSLGGVLPVAAGGAPSLLARVHDTLVGGLHERLAASVIKLQAAAETASAGKMAAVAASAAALATGGAVTAEQSGVLAHRTRHAAHARAHHARPVARAAAHHPVAVRPASSHNAGTAAPARAKVKRARPSAPTREFGFEAPAAARQHRTALRAKAATAGAPPPTRAAAPKPASNPSPEFGFEAAR